MYLYYKIKFRALRFTFWSEQGEVNLEGVLPKEVIAGIQAYLYSQLLAHKTLVNNKGIEIRLSVFSIHKN